jgi:hypothetical protein
MRAEAVVRSRIGAPISFVALLAVALSAAACSGGGPQPDADSGDGGAQSGETAGAGAEETDAAERSAAIESASTRVGGLTIDVEALSKRTEPFRDELAADRLESLSRLEDQLDAVESRLDDLRTADGETWSTAHGGLVQQLDGLESTVASLERQLDDELAELEAQRQAREEQRRQEIRTTGLIEGLDGEVYVVCGPDVIERVQRRLEERGFYSGEATGHLSEWTMESIAEFQRDFGMHVSGVPTPRTRRALFGDSAEPAESAA